MSDRDQPSARRPRHVVAALLAVISLLSACGGSSPTPPASASPEPSAEVREPALSTDAPPLASGSHETASQSPSASSAAASTIPSSGALALLWQKAGPTTIQAQTYWPTIDPVTGDIWVADSRDSKYWIFKPDGTYVGSWGTPGHGPGQLALTTHDPNPDSVGAIAFLPDGSFYLADNGDYRVEQFDKDRHFVRAWGSFGTDPGKFVSPKGIATDGKVVYVADDPVGMSVFDMTGHFLRAFPVPFVLFNLTPDGHLVFGDNDFNAVDIDDGMGNKVASYPVDFPSLGPDESQAGSPTGASMAVQEASGSILVGLQNDSSPVGLIEVDQHGAIVRRWTTGCETMLLSPDGSSVYMASTGAAQSSWPYLRKYALPKG